MRVCFADAARPHAPARARVRSQVKEAEDQTSGGLFMPDKAKEKPTEGLIVDVGPGRAHPETGVIIPPPVSAGEDAGQLLLVSAAGRPPPSDAAAWTCGT